MNEAQYQSLEIKQIATEQIIAKELSLGVVQRPLDPALLGENAIQWFWFGEFAGWIITP